jgi:hypothetical protein
MSEPKGSARRVFEAYHSRLTPPDEYLPNWDRLPRVEQEAWQLAADAVYRQARNELKPRTVWDSASQLEQDAELFEGVEFLVQATDTERFLLWCENENDKSERKVKWEQTSRGAGSTLGWLDTRPISVTLFYAVLNGKKVAFYDATSQVTDHAMVDDWLKTHTLDHIRYDNNQRWAHCNAMNFHHCLSYVRDPH